MQGISPSPNLWQRQAAARVVSRRDQRMPPSGCQRVWELADVRTRLRGGRVVFGGGAVRLCRLGVGIVLPRNRLGGRFIASWLEGPAGSASRQFQSHLPERGAPWA